MAEWIKLLIPEIKDRWHTRTGLLIALVLVTGTLVGVFAKINLTEVTGTEWAIIIASAILVSVVWAKTRVPRVPKGKVGFALAIDFEEPKQARQLWSDFILIIRDLLNKSNFRHRFHFVEIPQHFAKSITTPEEAERIATRARIHFLLYGRARERSISGKMADFIDLHVLVRHAQIDTETSRQFGHEISAVLPGRIIVAPGGNLFACEFAAKHLDAAARYIIGSAAFLSGDFLYAEELLLDSEGRVKAYLAESSVAQLAVLFDKVQKRLASLYDARLRQLSQRYLRSHEAAVLTEAEAILAKLKRYDAESYSARLLSALCAFVLRRDISLAKQEFEACRHVKDAAWSYGQAFLHAYEGDLDGAYKSYRTAFKSPLEDPSIPGQCEEFIMIVLEEEADRPWLYYCLGLINYRAKHDLEVARNDFQRFVQLVDPERFRKDISWRISGSTTSARS